MMAGGHFQIADDNTFFFHDADNKFPFATIVTKDSEFDNASKLDRPGAFRLNIGVGKESFRALFGEAPAAAADPAALDTLMPHPVYGKMYWHTDLRQGEAPARRGSGLGTSAQAGLGSLQEHVVVRREVRVQRQHRAAQRAGLRT
eukprot:gene67464-92415_t